MNSRDQILGTIRQQLPQSAPLPDFSGDWIEYDDPAAQFAEVLTSVGGVCHVVSSVAEISTALGLPLTEDKRVVSGVPGVAEPNFNFHLVSDPHEMADVELVILPGKLAVAENAAIWVQTDSTAQRAACFLTQHLALVVPLSDIVSNLHEAYDRIQIETAPFGCFISGPSKTADIEQSLVKGAHGARTLQVFLID